MSELVVRRAFLDTEPAIRWLEGGGQAQRDAGHAARAAGGARRQANSGRIQTPSGNASTMRRQ